MVCARGIYNIARIVKRITANAIVYIIEQEMPSSTCVFEI